MEQSGLRHRKWIPFPVDDEEGLGKSIRDYVKETSIAEVEWWIREKMKRQLRRRNSSLDPARVEKVLRKLKQDIRLGRIRG